MVQMRTFSDGSFVVHKIYAMGYKGYFSVWCNPDGSMKDCQRMPNGASIPDRCIALRNTIAGIAKRIYFAEKNYSGNDPEKMGR